MSWKHSPTPVSGSAGTTTADRRLATEVTVAIQPKGWGALVTLTDGPYDISDEAALDEYARAIEIWSAGLTQLRASVDYSVDLRKVR